MRPLEKGYQDFKTDGQLFRSLDGGETYSNVSGKLGATSSWQPS